MGSEYSISHIATFSWLNKPINFYGAGDLVGAADFKRVARVLQAFMARPEAVCGLSIPARA